MKVHGTAGVKLIECINPAKYKWRVRWNVQPDQAEGCEGGVTYEEAEFSRKPSIDEIKKVVIDWINNRVDDDILRGFTWNDIPVWLSMQNQFNYKAAYDLAVQTSGSSLPVTFKFGTEAEPVYHTFTELSDITDFYVKAVAYTEKVLNDGWVEKDSYDFTPYE